MDLLKLLMKIFLIADGKDLSTAELLKRAEKAYGIKSNLFPFPAIIMSFMVKSLSRSDMENRLFVNFQVNSIKVHNLLGWSPIINMEQQLTKMARQDFRRGEV
jgi:nucleoside-diphosphate-sugar epimerase